MRHIKVSIVIFTCMLFWSLSLIPFAGAQANLPHSSLDSPIGPTLLGLRIGMNQAQLVAAYNGSPAQGHLAISPVYGKYILVQFFPNEDIPNITKRSIYISPISNGRVYRIRAEISQTPNGQLFDPNQIFSEYYKFRDNMSQVYPVIQAVEPTPPPSITECDGGSENARQLITAYSQSGWNQVSDNERAILAMHCGVISPWKTLFRFGPQLTFSLAINVVDGGGRYSDIVINAQHEPSEHLVISYIRAHLGE